MLDTGTLGGSARFDVRVNTSDTECTTTTIDGDTNAVLNVNNSDFIVFHNVLANIGRINLLGGQLQIEQPNGEYNVPGGIHLSDGTIFRYY